MMKFSDDAGEIDYAGVARYIKKIHSQPRRLRTPKISNG